jgi:hypothetical protein
MYERCRLMRLDGEVSRNGGYMRWNLNPSYIVFRPPHLLLFDEIGGRAEIRDVTTGRVCEVMEEKGMKPLRLTRLDQALLALCPRGLLELVEVSSRYVMADEKTVEL